MKDKNRNFLLIPLDITDRIHLYSGPMRDLFANIYNFSKDGIHTYRATIDDIMAFLHCSENSARNYVNVLLASGFITRESKVVICKSESKHAKFEYKADIAGILTRLDAGEDVWPVDAKKHKMGANFAPIIEDKKGANFEPKRVQILRKKGANFAPQDKEYIKNNKEYLSDESTRAREAEEREFFIIFFFRNAGNPADEVRRFAGYYQSKGWQDKDGRKYDTPEKRMGLAYGWDCKSGLRLSDTDDTKRFYNFLHSLFDIAGERGGIDPRLILDVRGGYRYHDGQLTWDCTDTVRKWFESLGYDIIRGLLDKNFCAGCKLYYDKI